MESIQKRWKYLRDKFARLLKAKKGKAVSGAGADDIEDVDPMEWEHFAQLLFLKDALQHRK